MKKQKSQSKAGIYPAPLFLNRNISGSKAVAPNADNIKTKLVKSGAGFTLIELLVVLAIIGLLAGVVTIALQNARVRGRDAKRAGDMRQMVTSLEQYRIAHGAYPTGSGSIAGSGSGVILDDPTAMDSSAEPFVPNYVPLIPASPTPADGVCDGVTGAGGNPYWYQVEDTGLTYTLTFCLGKDAGQWNSGVRFATPDGVQ